MSYLIDCKTVAQGYLEWVAKAKAELDFTPCLVAVLFRPKQDPASQRYRDLILKDAASLGFSVRSHEAENEPELLSLIESLNADEDVTGIMVFYPLKASVADE